MTRKITRKGLVRKLDKVVFELVKQRDRVCITCGSRSNPTSSHLFSRKAFSTRWDLMNVYLQCWPENFKHTAHDPYPLTRYFIGKFGKRKYDELHRRFVTPRKFKDFELEELHEELTKQLND